jgi:hypothetical protein
LHAAWEYDGSRWNGRPAPGALPTTLRLRSLPDGGAWFASSLGQLFGFNADAWYPIVGAPWVTAVRAEDSINGVRGTPFDFSMTEAGPVGCVAARDAMYRWTTAGFVRVGSAPRGRVVDLQLTGDTSGWAIGSDTSPDRPPGSTSGVLLRIRDCEATEVPHGLTFQRLGPRFQEIEDAQWRKMSAVNEREVWLWGHVAGEGLDETVLAGIAPFGGSNRYGWQAYSCSELSSLSAVAVDNGTDVWLVGMSACGPDASGITDRRYAGPVSRLTVRVADTWLFLPALVRGAELGGGPAQ